MGDDMSGRLRRSESGTRGVRRIVRREVAKAAASLKHAGGRGDEPLHDARKRLKKARAGLRLLRKSLGDRAYTRENLALRDAARPLAEVRDAKILLETSDALARRAAPAEARVLRAMRPALVADLKAARRTLVRGRALKRARRELKDARERIGTMSVGRHGGPMLGAGLTRVYRAGRDAFDEARARPTTENLHEWRKQVKYLWHLLQVLEPIRRAVIRKWAERAHRLSDRLGLDHDLAVLEARVRRATPDVSRTAAMRVRGLIGGRRQELQAEAVALGDLVFEERPRVFARRLVLHWRHWRSESRAVARAGQRARASRRGAGQDSRRHRPRSATNGAASAVSR
jgi:CHAD domain-containing protein